MEETGSIKNVVGIVNLYMTVNPNFHLDTKTVFHTIEKEVS